METIAPILPIFIIVTLGAVLRVTGFMKQYDFRKTNALVYWVGLPALLFLKTSAPMTLDDLAPVGWMVLVVLVGMLGPILLGYLFARMLRLSPAQTGSYVQGAYRGNLAYVGLPVIAFSLAGQFDAAELERAAALVLAPMVPVYNIVAVMVLVQGARGAGERPSPMRMVLNVGRNPLVLACVAGILWSLTGWELGAVAERTLNGLAQMALPLALLGIGASLNLSAFRGRLFTPLTASLLKVVAAPLIGLGVAQALGLDHEHTRIALIYLACPTAVMSYVMAQQIGTDEDLAGRIVVISTVLALVTLTLAVAY
jgi:hypothetical protein